MGTGGRSYGRSGYKVKVLRQAETDAAWRTFFKVPDDAKEMAFKISLLESLGGWPPDTAVGVELADRVEMGVRTFQEHRIYLLRYPGFRNDRVPPLVVLFYTDDVDRIAFVLHVLRLDEFEQQENPAIFLAVQRSRRHKQARTRKSDE